MLNSKTLHNHVYLIQMAALLLLLGACTRSSTPVEPTQTPTAAFTDTPSSTAIPTETATRTPSPSLTPTPVSLPTTPVPTGPRLDDLPVISSANVTELSQVVTIELGEGDQVTWSPSGEAFTVSSPSGMDVYRLDAFSAPISLRYQSQPYFSADGSYMGVRLENRNIQVWDLEDGSMVGEYGGLQGEVVYLAFSPNLDRLAAASIGNQVLVWELASGEIIARLEVPEWVIPITYTYNLLFSPDQSHLALFREGEVLLWEIEGSREPRRLHWEPPPASPVHGPDQFSPDWGAVAWSDRGRILIMDVVSVEHVNAFERQVGANYTFTQDWGSLVVIGYNDNVISEWDPFSGEALQLLEHEEIVFRFWLSPDERYLASLTFVGRAMLWDLTSGVVLVEMTGEEEVGEWLKFSDQGDQLALLLNDGRISLWDIPVAAEKFTSEGEATRTFLFSPDGTLLLYATSDGGLKFLDTTSGEQMLEIALTGAPGEVSPYFVYNGKVLAVETGDELQLWGIYSAGGQPSVLNMRPLVKPYWLKPVFY